jgi:carbohydrate diacid regulator
MIKCGTNKKVKKEILKFCNLNVEDSETNPETVKNYVKLLEIKEVNELLNDQEIIKTVDVFFQNSLNASATSKNAYMHRNTLNYRLKKIEKLVGLNIKNFEEARMLKNLIIVNNFINKNS